MGHLDPTGKHRCWTHQMRESQCHGVEEFARRGIIGAYLQGSFPLPEREPDLILHHTGPCLTAAPGSRQPRKGTIAQRYASRWSSIRSGKHIVEQHPDTDRQTLGSASRERGLRMHADPKQTRAMAVVCGLGAATFVVLTFPRFVHAFATGLACSRPSAPRERTAGCLAAGCCGTGTVTTFGVVPGFAGPRRRAPSRTGGSVRTAPR
jgi:hypothetical protein